MTRTCLLSAAAAMTLFAAPALAQSDGSSTSQTRLPDQTMPQSPMSTPNSINTTGPTVGTGPGGSQQPQSGVSNATENGPGSMSRTNDTSMSGTMDHGTSHTMSDGSTMSGQSATSATGQSNTRLYSTQGGDMAVNSRVIANAPIPDTAETRRMYPPLSRGGRATRTAEGPVRR